MKFNLMNITKTIGFIVAATFATYGLQDSGTDYDPGTTR